MKKAKSIILCVLVSSILFFPLVVSNNVLSNVRTDTVSPVIFFTGSTPTTGNSDKPHIPIYIKSTDENEHYTLLDFNDDLLLWIHMDYIDTTVDGVVVYDNSSYQHHGYVNGSATQVENGRFGESYQFAHDEDYIHIEHQLITDKTFSFGGWIKCTQLSPPGSTMMIHGDSDGSGYYLHIDRQGMVIAYYWDSEGTERFILGYYIQLDTWTHLFIVSDEEYLYLYINGIDAGQCLSGSPSGSNFTIGNYPYSPSEDNSSFIGEIDEVVFFDRSLTQWEIKSLVNASQRQYYHNFNYLPNGNYTYTGYAVDSCGNKNQTETRWRNIANAPPTTPSIPEGSDQGVLGVDYDFSTNTTDPNDHMVSYGWDWDDDFQVDTWSGAYQSGEIATTSHYWSQEGIYEVRVKARDFYLKESNWSDFHLVSMINNHPDTPSSPNGPKNGTVGCEYSFTTCTSDPDNHLIRYGWDWGDGSLVEWTDYVKSDTLIRKNHTWTVDGVFEIRVKAEDYYGKNGNWSESLAISVINNPPTTPAIPEGPEVGSIGERYFYVTNASDPDGHLVRYGWDWGDGSPVEWTDFGESGEEITRFHRWDTGGDYQIRVKSEDIYGKTSNWSQPLLVHITTPVLEIGSISGGLFKVNAVLQNIGDQDAGAIDWKIHIDGQLILLGSETSDRIDIEAGNEVEISSDPIIGFGPMTITIIAELSEFEISDEKEFEGFVLLFFVIIK